MENTTSRLRRTFAYPTDSPPPSPTSAALALDEQEQDDLISTLAQQNDARNAQFRILLLCLPAVSSLPYLFALLSPLTQSASGAGTTRSIALLSLTSLACTAWTLWVQAPGVTGIRVLDAWVGASGKDGAGTKARSRGARDDYGGGVASSPFWAEEHRGSPLARYLPYLNLGLCAVLVLTGLLTRSGASQGHWGHVGLSNLPAIVYGVVLLAKIVMGGVDPEKELSALRYEYKGA
ncbi:hypothetical protein F4781DRAFT_385856 [Annulohypoxylon bovei var. microspora]|nr:hypothetical protein F4781DRAFT_385856 [Annulohypoxylon bovei var. microspora]